MYFLVFLTFCFCCFFRWNLWQTLLKHNSAKTNSFQLLRVNISIFIWTMWKNSICIDFVHKITFWSNFSVRRACTKSYVTSEPYPRASQIWYQNVRETWKKKVIKCRGESFARCRVIARNVEGGGLLAPPPPPVFLGLILKTLRYLGGWKDWGAWCPLPLQFSAVDRGTGAKMPPPPPSLFRVKCKHFYFCIISSSGIPNLHQNFFFIHLKVAMSRHIQVQQIRAQILQFLFLLLIKIVIWLRILLHKE